MLAERTGIAVVSDFRTRDTAAGGEGAPLVPIADWWLFRSHHGVARAAEPGRHGERHAPARERARSSTCWRSTPGPATPCSTASSATPPRGLARHDEGGRRAAAGRAHEGLLAELLADPFFALPPPRSTGRERFGADYAARLREIADPLGLSLEDALATAVELTARTIARRHPRLPRAARRRGRASTRAAAACATPTLMRALAGSSEPLRFERLDALGVEPDAKEALAFALLAHLTLCGAPGNVPGATGARHPVVLGHITPGELAAEDRS